jgi:hypothetical protein
VKSNILIAISLCIGGLVGTSCSYGSYLTTSEQNACKAYGDVLSAQTEKLNSTSDVFSSLNTISAAALSAANGASTNLQSMLKDQRQDIAAIIANAELGDKAASEKSFAKWQSDTKTLGDHCNTHGWILNLG